MDSSFIRRGFLPEPDPLARFGDASEFAPLLSYDGYARYNWKRSDPLGPIALGNLDTVQDFVHLYDEHWFILVHVHIEALAAGILWTIGRMEQAPPRGDDGTVSEAVAEV